ncbi:MAG: type pantothenate kinase [Aeromicrobium sp.]|nr:type pantothenate kinase [Aeromicrobium sp.]
MTRDQSPYVELERAAWSELAGDAPQPLSTEEVERVRGLGDELDLEEVRQVYLPMTELISMRIRLAGALYEATEAFLHAPQSRRTPFVIGIAGSVAVGKSTTARLLRELLSHSPDHPHVELVTTDGFLFPNEELERRDLLERKGFPESYDRKALLRFVIDVKSGVEVVTAPVYSHLTYDRTDELVTLKAPDIVIVEGLNVLAPARTRGDGSPGLAISDFFDFSIYVDASSKDIRRWYVERFLTLRKTAFADPASYFNRYSALTDDEAVERAGELWDRINWPNLRENIQTTRGRASLVLRKGSDHAVDWVRLRKL